jgi:hypothetical protein
MDEEYAKAVEWHEDVYYDDVGECKAELKKECERKLAQIREDIESAAVI